MHHPSDHHRGQDGDSQQAHAAEPVHLLLGSPASASEGEPTLDEIIPGPSVNDPVNQVISSEELQSLVGCLSTALSDLESRVLSLYLDGRPYEEIAGLLDCDAKTVDNALQRVKRKVGAHLESRRIPA